MNESPVGERASGRFWKLCLFVSQGFGLGQTIFMPVLPQKKSFGGASLGALYRAPNFENIFAVCYEIN